MNKTIVRIDHYCDLSGATFAESETLILDIRPADYYEYIKKNWKKDHPTHAYETYPESWHIDANGVFVIKQNDYRIVSSNANKTNNPRFDKLVSFPADGNYYKVNGRWKRVNEVGRTVIKK